MRRRHQHENRYCNLCHMTTRHETKEHGCACLRCGTQKYAQPRLVVKRAS